MFSKITLENFKAFNHFELDLIENQTTKKAKKLAIIYGENSIGKSTIVDSFDLLSKTFFALYDVTRINKLFNNNSGSNEQFKEILLKSLNDLRVPSLINNLYKVDSNRPLLTRFEGFIEGDKFVYEASFERDGIHQEKLLVNNNIVFKIDKKFKQFTLSRNHFKNEDIINQISNVYHAYFGNFTFLSCINYVGVNVVPSFVQKTFSKELVNFMQLVEGMIVYKTESDQYSLAEAKTNHLVNDIVSGVIKNSKDELRLEKTKLALSMYFSSLYSNLKGVSYKLTLNQDKTKNYELMFVERNETGVCEVPFTNASTGTKKMVNLFNVFYNACVLNRIVVIDEIDTGINDLLLKCVFEAIDEFIKSQLIFTTHNTLLLDNNIKKYIYLMDRNPNYSISAYSLDEFGRKIQEKTDIIGQYLKGLYGGVPQCGSFSIENIIEAVKNYEK